MCACFVFFFSSLAEVIIISNAIRVPDLINHKRKPFIEAKQRNQSNFIVDECGWLKISSSMYKHSREKNSEFHVVSERQSTLWQVDDA